LEGLVGSQLGAGEETLAVNVQVGVAWVLGREDGEVEKQEVGVWETRMEALETEV
jgi:surfactin synthase thioesterase subunit